jgi:hypothetical protein
VPYEIRVTGQWAREFNLYANQSYLLPLCFKQLYLLLSLNYTFLISFPCSAHFPQPLSSRICLCRLSHLSFSVCMFLVLPGGNVCDCHYVMNKFVVGLVRVRCRVLRSTILILFRRPVAGRDVHQVHCRPVAGASKVGMFHPIAWQSAERRIRWA